MGAESTLVYFDGNSLGRPLKVTGPRLQRFVEEEWGGRLIRGWDEGWFELPEVIGDDLGRVALGAATPGSRVVGDSTTVLLYKLLRAAVALRPGRTEIVLDRDNFPTDRYVAEGVARECGLILRWVDVDPSAGITADQLAAVLGPQTAVVLLSHVAYRSAWVADVPTLTRDDARRRRADAVGPVPLGRCAARAPRRVGRRPGRRLHLQVPQRRVPARPRSATSPPGCSTRSPSRSRAGWGPPTRS